MVLLHHSQPTHFLFNSVEVVKDSDLGEFGKFRLSKTFILYSIRGGREFGRMPLFVLKIADGGPADEDGRLRVGDQLIMINKFVSNFIYKFFYQILKFSVDTTDMTHENAIQLIRQAGTVSLTVRRLPSQQQPPLPPQQNIC